MKILDLFCKAGGASMGLHQAFPCAEIVGVDIEPQSHYPFTFRRADAMSLLANNTRGDLLDEFDFLWASPVCKRYSGMTNCRPGKAKEHPDDIAKLRMLLEITGKPWVIENVPGSPLRNPVVLCGTMFGLDLYRHRLFEANFPISTPRHRSHRIKASRAGHWQPGTVMSVSGNFSPVAHARQIMGIDWMTRDELSQAIPPAYSKFIGEQYKKTIMSDLTDVPEERLLSQAHQTWLLERKAQDALNPQPIILGTCKAFAHSGLHTRNNFCEQWEPEKGMHNLKPCREGIPKADTQHGPGFYTESE